MASTTANKIDLHLHTTASDGFIAPEELVRAAAAAALDVIAITDHDTAAGVREAPAAWGQCRVVPGMEVSSTFQGVDLHILGYYIDPAHPAILGHEQSAVRRRDERMREMIGKLEALGKPVRYEDVIDAAGGEDAILGRPHLARALVSRGHVPNVPEAFNRYLGDGGPAFAPVDLLTPEQAIDMIHAAGGVAVWAHPPLDVFEAEIRRLAEAGLDGVECFRPKSTPIDMQLLEGYADELGLLTTGGSDWHGRGPVRVGDFFVRREEIRKFLEIGGL